MKKSIFILLAVLLLSSCGSVRSYCPTYSNAKPLGVKVGSYNPIKPYGLNAGKKLVIN